MVRVNKPLVSLKQLWTLSRPDSFPKSLIELFAKNPVVSLVQLDQEEVFADDDQSF